VPRALWLIAAGFGFAVVAAEAAAVTVTDWKFVDPAQNVASGMFGPVAISLSGGDVSFGVTNGSFTGFDYPFFTPPLATSDTVEVIAAENASHTYTVSFAMPVTNPRVHVYSLASTLTFNTTVIRVSGQAAFVVSGANAVVGEYLDGTTPNDANGTIELPGTMTGFTFTAEPLGAFSDGLLLQILGDMVFAHGFETEAAAP
jgi:hypothetical protein